MISKLHALSVEAAPVIRPSRGYTTPDPGANEHEQSVIVCAVAEQSFEPRFLSSSQHSLAAVVRCRFIAGSRPLIGKDEHDRQPTDLYRVFEVDRINVRTTFQCRMRDATTVCPTCGFLSIGGSEAIVTPKIVIVPHEQIRNQLSEVPLF